MSELNKAYQELEAIRSKKFKTSLFLFILGPILLITGLILFFIASDTFEDSALFVIAIFLFLTGFVLFAIGLGVKASFSKQARNNMEKIICDHLFPGATYSHDEGFELSFLLSPGFFASPDRYYGSEYMKGTYKGIPFQKAMYDLQKRQTHTDSKGNTIVTYDTYAKGTMYYFEFSRHFKETVKIIEKQGILSFGSTKGGLKQVETEFIQFNKKFRILCSNETTVFYLLTPQIQEEVMNLEKKYKGSFFMAFMDNALFVAINDSGATVSIPFSKPISEETMRPVVDFYGTPATIIDSLKLDGNKYKADALTSTNNGN